MRLTRVLEILCVAAILSMVIAVGWVNSYFNSQYGLIQVSFQVQVFAYKLDGGDYAAVYNHTLVLSFTRMVPTVLMEPNKNTTPIAYSTGQLDHSLSISVRVTLTSLSNSLVFPTECNFTFSRPGSYNADFFHILRQVPAGQYLVNMTYTDSVHELPPRQIWSSIVYYYDLE